MSEQVQSTEVKPDRIVIMSKANGRRFEADFFLKLQEAILDGYRIAETNLRDDVSMRMFRGRIGRAVLYKEGTQPKALVSAPAQEAAPEDTTLIEKTDPSKLSTGVAENSPIPAKEPEKEPEKEPATEPVELSLLDQLESLTKLQELKDFADTHKIELPEGVTNPKSVKKVIKAALEG